MALPLWYLSAKFEKDEDADDRVADRVLTLETNARSKHALPPSTVRWRERSPVTLVSGLGMGIPEAAGSSITLSLDRDTSSPDGTIGRLSLNCAYFSVTRWNPMRTVRSIRRFRPAVTRSRNSKHLYRAQLEATLPYLAGETDTAPFAGWALIEPELCALAARKSWLNADAEILLSELTEADGGYDGPTFAVGYRKMRYPQG